MEVNEITFKKSIAEKFINNNKELFPQCNILSDISTWGEYSEEFGNHNTIMVTFHNIPIKKYSFYFKNNNIVEAYDVTIGKEKIY